MSLIEKIQSETCTLRLKNDWLKIFTCPVPSSDFLSFVGIATIDAPQHAVLSLLFDIEAATEWVWKTKEMRLLQELSADNGEKDNGRVVYQLVSAPWPVSDREIITRSQGYMDPDTSEVFIKLECLPDFLPKNDKYVRVPHLEGAWNIIPLSANQCRVVFRLHIEPGGEIPSWLANIAVIDTPYHTMNNMRDMVKKDKYRISVEAPFIKSAKDVIQNYQQFIAE
ncbi:cyclase [Chlorobium sp. BLA1]|uniref:START domain-containing protein n=1 Tax=Candidatus Chlorobium masyuteum TaxID=2716876 RepID=UPI00141E2B06|nr:START domain-containing protein [Candidatus Chlorobium masyuteum]NHQ60481.1 cyclase [Candidatus Chlorobium masyuteum]NTU43940.1 cyclase [Chlorobiaceae bacterium]